MPFKINPKYIHDGVFIDPNRFSGEYIDVFIHYEYIIPVEYWKEDIEWYK